MKLLVTDLTRMGFRDGEQTICIAGADIDTGMRIRPVLPYPRSFSLKMAAPYGGPFDIGRIVELGHVEPQPGRPETEDVLVEWDALRHLRTLPTDEFFASLSPLCVERPSAAIGDALMRHPNGRNLVTLEGHGDASLAIEYVPTDTFDLYIDARGRVRSRWPDGIVLSVTDLRLYESGGRPLRGRVERLNDYLALAPSTVAFGLTRPFAPDESGQRFHWLQVNAIHVPISYGWSTAFG